jgi:hypothetical protein
MAWAMMLVVQELLRLDTDQVRPCSAQAAAILFHQFCKTLHWRRISKSTYIGSAQAQY